MSSFTIVALSLVVAASAGAVSVEPDLATAEDLSKAKELLAIPDPVMERAPRFAPDGQRLLYVSNGAVFIKELGAEARKVAPAPRKLRRPVFSPDGASIYFTADEGGDEAYAIHRMSVSDGAVELITPDQKLRRGGPFFVKGGRMLFTARTMEARGVALFELKGREPVALFADDTLELGALRRDGGQMLATTTGTSSALFVVDLPTAPGARAGTPRRLYPPAGKDVTIFGVAYSPDGKRALVASDGGGDGAVIIAIDIKSGRGMRKYVEAQAPASSMQELQAAGDRVAFVIDSGTRHDLRILDATTLASIAVTPALPPGSEVPGAMHPNSTGGMHLSPDGKRVALEWSTPTSPPRIHIVDTGTGARTTLNGDSKEAAAIDTSIVSIPSFDGLSLPTLVYLPAKSEGKKLPVVVQMHGGFPFAATARFDPRITTLLAEGYAVVEPNVRGSGGFGRAYEVADDGIHKLNAFRDLGAIARWTAAQPWADAKRLALMGRSAGGYYTLIGLEHDPDIWSCGIAIVPLFDLEDTMRNTDGDLREFWEKKELVPIAEPMLLAAMSPSMHIARLQAPLFYFAAARDARATLAQNEALVRALRGRGAKLEYMRSADGHVIDDPRTRAELMARTLRFLRTSCVR